MLDEKALRDEMIQKKLYQLIIGRLDAAKTVLPAYRQKVFDLVKRGIGGFIVFGGEKEEVRYLIHALQSISAVPLFIASDIERGVGQQIKGCTLFPCQMAVSAALCGRRPEDIEILRGMIEAVADEAKDIGINMPLIPVLDVNRDPDNPIICTRAFSDDPGNVAWFGSQYITILENSGLLSCAKHFPGHGDTSTDSHLLLPVIRKSYQDLLDTDILPFRKAVTEGVSSVMVGHLRVPSLDRKPATLSKKIITSVLRAELGFHGLVLTDALNMHALKDIEGVPLHSLKAGIDILLHPDDPDSTVEELLAAISSRKIPKERIDAAVNRIAGMKGRLRTFVKKDIDYQKHQVLSSRITDMSITLVKEARGLLPLSDRNMVHIILAGDPECYLCTPLRDSFRHVSRIFEKVDLQRRIPVFALFTSVAAWKGSSGISADEQQRIHALMKEAGKSAVISFGSPYVLRHFMNADALIAAYEPTVQAQRAVMQCLDGRLDFKGQLPVTSSFEKR
jgi:beta-glucosidase-like glycosyl hydrolase